MSQAAQNLHALQRNKQTASLPQKDQGFPINSNSSSSERPLHAGPAQPQQSQAQLEQVDEDSSQQEASVGPREGGAQRAQPGRSAPRSTYQFTQMKATTFYGQLKRNIKQRGEFFGYDAEANKFTVSASGYDSYCRKQYSFQCKCSICTSQARKIQDRDDFRTLEKVTKDERAFADFVNKELNADGVVKKTVEQDKQGMLERLEEESDRSSPDEDKIDYLRDLRKSKKGVIKSKDHYVFQQKSFNWLMEMMVAPPDSTYPGCQVNIPDMVLLEGGRPKYFLRSEKNGCIAHIMRNKIYQRDIQTFFGQLGNERFILRSSGINDLPDQDQDTTTVNNRGIMKKTANAEDDLPSKRGMKNTEDTSIQIYNQGLEESASPNISPDRRDSTNQSITFGSVDARSQETDSKANNGPGAGLRMEKSISKHYGQDRFNKRNADQSDSRNRSLPSKARKKPRKSQKQTDMKDQFYADQFIFRYGTNDKSGNSTSKILSEADFHREFASKARTTEYWQTVSSIQMTPQYKIGLGKYIRFTFSPLCIEKKSELNSNQQEDKVKQRDPFDPKYVLKDPDAEVDDYHENMTEKLQGSIIYDCDQFHTDDTCLQLRDPETFCIKVCHRIGQYFQVVHEIDILRMQVEFYRDETGLVQFYHAKNIWMRCLQSNKIFKEKPKSASNLDCDQIDESNVDSASKPGVYHQGKIVRYLKALQQRKLLNTVIKELGDYSPRADGSLIKKVENFGKEVENIEQCEKIRFMVNKAIIEEIDSKKLDDLDSKQSKEEAKFPFRRVTIAGCNGEDQVEREVQVGESAFDRIGHFGALESVLEPSGDEGAKKQQMAQKKKPMPRSIFDKAGGPQSQGLHQKNLLEWLRNQKERENFLIPMVQAQAGQFYGDQIKQTKVKQVKQGSHQAQGGPVLQRPEQASSPKQVYDSIYQGEDSRLAGSRQLQSQPTQGAKPSQTSGSQSQFNAVHESISTLSMEANLAKDQATPVSRTPNDRGLASTAANYQSPKSHQSQERLESYKNQNYSQTKYAPKESDQALIYESNRPMQVKEKVMQHINLRQAKAPRARKRPTLLPARGQNDDLQFSKRVQQRLNYKLRQKQLEQSQHSLLRQQSSAVNIYRSQQTLNNQNNYGDEPLQPSLSRHLNSHASLKAPQITQMGQPQSYKESQLETIQRQFAEQRATNSRNIMLPRVQSMRETGSALVLSQKQRQSQRAQKQLDTLRVKIQRSHRALVKNNVISKLKFELKEPGHFGEWLGIQTRQSNSLDELLNSQRSNPQQQSSQTSQVQRNLKSSLNQLIDTSQMNSLLESDRNNGPQINVRNISNNLFEGRKSNQQGFMKTDHLAKLTKGSKTPQIQSLAETQNRSDKQPLELKQFTDYQKQIIQTSRDADDRDIYMVNLGDSNGGPSSPGRRAPPAASKTAAESAANGTRQAMINDSLDPIVMSIQNRSLLNLNHYNDARPLEASGQLSAPQAQDSALSWVPSTMQLRQNPPSTQDTSKKSGGAPSQAKTPKGLMSKPAPLGNIYRGSAGSKLASGMNRKHAIDDPSANNLDMQVNRNQHRPLLVLGNSNDDLQILASSHAGVLHSSAEDILDSRVNATPGVPAGAHTSTRIQSNRDAYPQSEQNGQSITFQHSNYPSQQRSIRRPDANDANSYGQHDNAIQNQQQYGALIS